jgi:hydroxymethylglutaryl-CoA lyase
MGTAESLKVIKDVVSRAKEKKLLVRGYLSTAFGCPFEGRVSPKRVLSLAERLLSLGVDNVSIGDTIGVATPGSVDQTIPGLVRALGKKQIAVHFHDTRGTALANTLRSIEHGVSQVDSSAGGLGGCPFAPGATGNLATEDLVYMLQGMGVETGVNLERLCEASLALAQVMKRRLSSRYLAAYSAQCH